LLSPLGDRSLADLVTGLFLHGADGQFSAWKGGNPAGSGHILPAKPATDASPWASCGQSLLSHLLVQQWTC
jgi:hypothetical protein